MTTPFNLASFADKVSSTGTANPSAISDIANTSTGALAFPVGTTAQRNGTPVNGMTRINSTTSVLEVYYNGSWVTISTFTPPGPTVIGQAWGGGYYAGQISTTGDGVATHYLIVAPLSTGETTASFKTSDSSGDPTSVIDGPANSATMNNTSHPAAYFCEGLTIGGYTDWYLPAQDELSVVYFNLKPGTTANYNPNSNPYSVPPVGPYTSGNPAQTTATAFQTGGSQAFTNTYYWTSSQNSSNATLAVATTFDFGKPDPINGKTNSFKVRAVRRIPI